MPQPQKLNVAHGLYLGWHNFSHDPQLLDVVKKSCNLEVFLPLLFRVE